MIDITIVGAGITAIALAKLHPDKKILILEKSRGVGGRIATRRLGSTWVDHGAEHFEPSDPLLREFLASYDPEQSSNQWIKNLSQHLNIKKECRVEKIIQTKQGLEIWDSQKQLVCLSQKVIITAPAPQAKEILDQSNLEASFLNEVEYYPCVQFFLLIHSELPFPKEEGPFYRLKKKIKTGVTTLYHFEVTENFLPQFLECEKEEIKIKFLEEIKPDQLVDSHAHKWRYSTVKKSIPSMFQMIFKDKNIYLAGDYFDGDDVNAAVRSAKQLQSN